MTTAAPHTPPALRDELVALAERLALEAAALLVDGLRRDRVDVATKTSGTDMVTEMDHASEALILEGVRSVRPDDGFLGEEGSTVAGTSGVRWVIDPIDGTTNYLYSHPGFSVSIAVEVEGVAVVGVVVDPLHDDVFTAVRGGGARCNGEPIRASAKADLPTALVGTGFAYEGDRRRRQAEVLGRIIGDIRDVRRMGAASVDLCSVACGRLDAYYERGLAPWDLAAGVLVAVEAGARVGALDGGPPSDAFVLAAAPAIFDPLRRLLSAAGAGEA
ncbi:inositol monophosphatase family protein [soil metagenome]